MWTVCWISKVYGDNWNCFPNKNDVINLTNTLVREGDVDPNDIVIFPPPTDI